MKLEDIKEPEKGYVINCLLELKDGEDMMFRQKDGLAIAYLDGYAIIPMEKYNEPKQEDEG